VSEHRASGSFCLPQVKLTVPDEELYWLGRGLDAYRKHLGPGPRGWRAPSFAFSKHSLRYLIEAGFEYDSSLMGDDIPYALKDGNASLLEFPVDWTLDDFPHYAHNRDLGYRMPISSPSSMRPHPPRDRQT
jgi:peptidoglycan/xylan/chitin deacetylase (PgdA/CDA1 family)